MKCLIDNRRIYTIVKEVREIYSHFYVHQPELAIVFGRTKRRVDELTSALIQRIKLKAYMVILHKRNV